MAPLSLVECGHGAVDTVVQEDGSPWEQLGFYEKQVQMHLEGSQKQLQRLSEVKVAALRSTLGALSSESQEMFELRAHENSLRSNLAEKIQDLRNGIESLAKLILEIQWHRQNGDQTLVKECYVELQHTTDCVRENFQGQKKFFLDTLTKHKAETAAHSKDADAADRETWYWGVAALLLGGISGMSWYALSRDLSSSNSDVCGNLLKALVDWIVRLVSKPERAFPQVATAWYPVVPFVTTAAFAWSFRQSINARMRYKQCLQLKHQVCANTDFVRANEEMWTGMSQLVYALSEKVKYFHDLNKQREDRIHQTLKDLGTKMFNMVMSVDVYMVWMERHNMFPPNVTVSVMMGWTKYQAIHSKINPKRRWFTFGGA